MNELKPKWLLANLAWGMVYALFLQTRIGWLIDKELTSLGVVIGVAGVLVLSTRTLGFKATLNLLGMFAFAGAPMVLRNIWNIYQRYEQLRQAQER